MKRRKWASKEKFEIVMQGLKGISIADICREYEITQSQYYQWRDKLLSDGDKLFERGGIERQVERLEKENRKLKETVGELTIELKKNDW